ncbi:hypothetical protein ACQK5W_16320 [Pantoea sp. FN060301]|uniref:hypothetical protein n=1 Tax=Pantoea sp. FN060301 TaxID=3420380 RepID=UPI003D162B2F
MKKYRNWAAAIAIVGALTGCARTAPIENIHTNISTGHTQDQVKNAILKAGIERKWTMSGAGPGIIKARQQARGHVADVRITYSATGYDITYESSTNLKATEGKIHTAYNSWVHNLDNDIQINLSAAGL